MLAPSARLPLRSRGSVAGLAFHAPGTGSGATRNSSAPTGTTTLQVPNRGAARSGGRGIEPDQRISVLLWVASGRRGARVRLRNWVSGMVTAWLALPLFVTLELLSTVSLAAPPPAAAVFGALPAQSFAVLSPDGHWLAWMDQTEVKPRIVIFDVTDHKVRRIAAVPERAKLRVLRWSDSETLLVTLSETGEAAAATQLSREYYLTVALDPMGQGALMLPVANGRAEGARAAMAARLVRIRTTKPHTIIMSSHIARGNADCLLEVDTTNGKSEIIKVGNAHTINWAVDGAGRPIAREDWDWMKSAYRVYALSGDSIKEILRKDDSSPPSVVGLLPDNSALVLLASNGRPHQAAWALPLDGSAQKLLAEDPNVDIAAAFEDPYSGAVVGVYESGSETNVHWLEPAAAHRQEVLQRAFPSRQVHVYGWTADGTKTLARVESPNSPPIYYLVDFATHRADIAAEEYPALANVPLGELKKITYKARDGTEIPAYLTLPPDKAARPGPLVVLPHGGPNARDYPTFDWIVQFLASRGYAVLQPQFRGSTGFGDAFEKAGYRQWGGLMQDDVTDGVQAMIEQGVADPRRICIVGISYGGYAALAGAAFTPKLYACAISVSGVSDLRAFLDEKVPTSWPGYRVISASMSAWKERIGSPNDSALAKKSPINSIASITAPVLIVYGTGDAVVPNAQSERMATALKAAGKPITVVKLADEDHWLSRTDTRVQMLEAFESFLRDNL
jgi:dipeptidyl aminopeptidase/acylaminoacyl peptidase